MTGPRCAIAALFTILVGAGISTCHEARAHDWYGTLKTPQGYSCCNGTVDGKEGDCRPVQARPTDDGGWEAFFGGDWRRIPAERILPDHLNRVPLHSHICEQDLYVRCFLRGGGGT